VGAAAGRAAAERADLRAAEDAMAGSVVALQAMRERAEPEADELVVCPFKGLGAFDVEDAGVFFGRERMVAEMVARAGGRAAHGRRGAVGQRQVVGAARRTAGVARSRRAPRQRALAARAGAPGEHPLDTLEHAIAAVPLRGRLVVAVDQFEELFTACRDESERAAFVDALLACMRDPRRRALVLLAVRADYYGRCAAYPELARLLGITHVLVGPMRRDELRRAIELPAHRAGLKVEPALADALIAMSRAGPEGCRCSPPRCSSCGATATAARCA
jgi:hypothetical protein